ncbi:MAG: hypothetical protein GC188_03775 [Alphaproteobacteria bacterium]|nr:hypothetical protein [Alphaproteobacteria bacterium]
MQKILSLSAAGAALLAAGCTTAAMANDDAGVRENVEVIVQNTETTGQSVIIHGVNVEFSDGEVIISGDSVRTTADGRVIVADGQANVLPSGAGHRAMFRGLDGVHVMRLAEASAALEHLEAMRFEIDEIRTEEMERALAHVETELENLHGQRMVVINGERREMTDEEREEVRRELAEAREDIAESMRGVRIELQEAEGDRREAVRVMRIELEQAEREAAEAGREARRVHVIARRNQDINEEMRRALQESGGYELRFVSEDGESRVWVDGEELEGDARIDWLNRLETERLAGGSDSDRREIIIEIDEDDEE